RRPYNWAGGLSILVFVFWSLWRRWRIPKFAVPNSPACVGNVAGGSQCHCAEQNHSHYERRRGFPAFHSGHNFNRTQYGVPVENPDEIRDTIFVVLELSEAIFL